jgi:hypothetical protein
MSNEKDENEVKVTEVNKNPDAPLVVDLPDGQKLMVGQLPPGTVVEIATWRGTSRPDSRTTRLLLGVSAVNSEENSDSTEKVNSESNSTNEVKMQRRNRKKKSTMLSSRIKTVLVSIALLATVIGLFVLSPLQIVKPTLGASIGFGSADSSLVVALAVDEISPGTPVVAYLGSDKDTIVFGSLSQMVDEAVLIQTDGGFAQSSKENLIGRSVLVIPFLGKLF